MLAGNNKAAPLHKSGIRTRAKIGNLMPRGKAVIAMTEEIVNYPSIEQVHHLRKQMEYAPWLPEVLTLVGTVKLHGTHGDIRQDAEGLPFVVQSRNRVLGKDGKLEDNKGFYTFCMKRQQAFEDMLTRVRLQAGADPVSHRECREEDKEVSPSTVMIAGEFCGKGIQKGVGVGQVDPFFVVLDLFAFGYWQDISSPLFKDILQNEEHRIYNIHQFKTYEIPTVNKQDLVDQLESNSGPLITRFTELAEEVGLECPVAKALGVTGGCIAGEGVVWKYKEAVSYSRLWFKTKCEKHQVLARPKEKVVSQPSSTVVAAQELAQQTITEARLHQGIDYLIEFNLAPKANESIGKFVQWVVNDALKEEGGELDELAVPAFRKAATKIALEWFKKQQQAQSDDEDS